MSAADAEAYDTTGASLRFETPEGIDLLVRPAGPVARGLAFSIDESITWLGSAAVFAPLGFLGEAGVGVYLVIVFLTEWFYPVLFEVLRGGQTPGKSVMSLRVVNADATPIGWNASLLRNLLRVADLVPMFYLLGLASMCLTRRFQRLGDLAADTLVIHVADPAPSRPVSEDAVDQVEALGAVPPPLPLSSEEQRALLGYAERQSGLSVDRAIELSDVLAPLSGAKGEAGRRALLRIANGVVGDG